MGNAYSYSTIDSIGDLTNGLHVETTVYDVVASWKGTVPVQLEIFNIFGRILVLQLFIEMVTQATGGATILQFNATWTDPAAATIEPISNEAATVENLAAGSRLVWKGGAIATVPVSTVLAGGGISDDIAATRQILGCVDGTGSIGTVPSIADMTAGTAQANIFYAPMSKGAYVTAAF